MIVKHERGDRGSDQFPRLVELDVQRTSAVRVYSPLPGPSFVGVAAANVPGLRRRDISIRICIDSAGGSSKNWSR